jgi:NAD(P)-dependent dehydrogenase (short-subunit alcohol dehydrogenase family)
MEILISGASSGIGRATAVHLARLGHQVWGGVRSEQAFADLRKINVRGLRPIYLDVTAAASIEAAVHRLTKEAGLLSALINNAGIAVGGPIEALSLDDWHRQFEVNLFGVVGLTNACLPLLRQSKGRIVNMSSVAGLMVPPLLGAYSASKFALEAYSDSLRRELRGFGIKVAVIEPGAIRTAIWQKSIAEGVKLKEQMPLEIGTNYGPMMERVFARYQKAQESSDSVQLVVDAVVHALSSMHPKTRYLLGHRAKWTQRIAGVLPDSWLDHLLS